MTPVRFRNLDKMIRTLEKNGQLREMIDICAKHESLNDVRIFWLIARLRAGTFTWGEISRLIALEGPEGQVSPKQTEKYCREIYGRFGEHLIGLVREAMGSRKR